MLLTFASGLRINIFHRSHENVVTKKNAEITAERMNNNEDIFRTKQN